LFHTKDFLPKSLKNKRKTSRYPNFLKEFEKEFEKVLLKERSNQVFYRISNIEYRKEFEKRGLIFSQIRKASLALRKARSLSPLARALFQKTRTRKVPKTKRGIEKENGERLLALIKSKKNKFSSEQEKKQT
jgi:hypothetical protein